MFAKYSATSSSRDYAKLSSIRLATSVPCPQRKQRRRGTTESVKVCARRRKGKHFGEPASFATPQTLPYIIVPMAEGFQFSQSVAVLPDLANNVCRRKVDVDADGLGRRRLRFGTGTDPRLVWRYQMDRWVLRLALSCHEEHVQEQWKIRLEERHR